MTIPSPQYRTTALLAIGIITLCQQAQAQFTVLYNFDSASSSAKTSADITGTGVLATSFSAPGAAGVSGSTDTAFLNVEETGSDLAAALADTDYFEFTLEANSGEFLDLSTFTFNFGGTTGNSANPGYNTNVVVQSNVAGFGTGNPILSVTPNTYDVPDNSINPTTIAASVDVSGSEFNNLASITFQIRFFDTSSSSVKFNRLDDIYLEGSTIPEPASIALLFGLGAIVCIGIQRKRS